MTGMVSYLKVINICKFLTGNINTHRRMIVAKRLFLPQMSLQCRTTAIQSLIGCMLFLFLTACSIGDGKPVAVAEIRREHNPVNFRAIDSAICLLKNGDLVLRTGADATSYMLRQMNRYDRTYSHCGIVMMEEGYPFVYHSIGGEDNPDSRLRRDSVSFFFSPVSNERLGIARLDISEGQIGKLHDIVKRYYKMAVPFDLSFDLLTDDRFYCAEFVYKSVREATADTGYFSVTHMARKTYVGVDNLFDPRHAKIICDVRFK